MRNLSTNVSDGKKEFTFDYDGHILIKEKIKKSKLPPMNPKINYESSNEKKSEL